MFKVSNTEKLMSAHVAVGSVRQSTSSIQTSNRVSDCVCVVTPSRYTNSLRLTHRGKKPMVSVLTVMESIEPTSDPAAEVWRIQPITYRSTEMRWSSIICACV
ncbi:hypothetical protein TNCV_4555171 [Trichonephila clavipes]|nr:hypothetical protein TNCV_4555171 [Trichonephila clavipes]